MYDPMSLREIVELASDFAIIAICVGGVLGVTAIVAWAVVRLLGGRSGGANDEEARIMQQTYRALNEMERRIEALETLLLDRNRQGAER